MACPTAPSPASVACGHSGNGDLDSGYCYFLDFMIFEHVTCVPGKNLVSAA